MEYKNIQFAVAAGIARLTLNRPDKLNSFTGEMHAELRDALDAIQADKAIRVLVLSGAGRAFCAGQDLADPDMQTVGGKMPDIGNVVEKNYKPLVLRLQNLRVPTIAAVNGIAAGAGASVALACDLVVAAEEARFATPGVKIGLFCSTPMVALSRAVGAKKAMEMLLTGELISAREAREAGLVNRVVPAAELAGAARALADRIAAASPLVVGLGKQAFYRQIDMPLHEAYAYASQVMSANAALADAQEGIGAFLEKRAPTWGGR